MKNHFYASIIKTLRKVIRNKSERTDLKELLIKHYSLYYLYNLFSDKQFLFSLQNENWAQAKSNITLRKLLVSNQIKRENIEEFHEKTKQQIYELLIKQYGFSEECISTCSLSSIFKAIVEVNLMK